MNRTTFRLSVLSLGMLALASCSKGGPSTPQGQGQIPKPTATTKSDMILVANVSKEPVQSVTISTNTGKVIWKGTLSASQQTSFAFTPSTEGHFVVQYDGATADKPTMVHKGYFTSKGGLTHTFTFTADGKLLQKTARDPTKAATTN